MLWTELKERAKQLKGPANHAAPLIGEIVGLWFEEEPSVEAAFADRDVSRDALVARLLSLEYPQAEDHRALDAIRGLPVPVTVEAVLGVLARQFEKHPVVQLLAGMLRCQAAQLAEILRLHAEAAVSVTASQTTALGACTTDLTETARRGAFADRVAGPATLALECALLKVRRGSVILTGPKGCGKTVSVEAFAHRVAHGETHPRLKNAHILELSVGGLLAGTQFRGQFSERVEALLKELKGQKGPTILWIDEIHTVLGAGRVHGDSYDLANALKTALADGSLLVVGATTDAEYERYVMKDPAFARRFQRIRLAPLTGETLLKVVRSQTSALAKKHGAVIADDVCLEALALSDRYLANRAAQPDRGLDLLDTACALAGPSATLGRAHLLAALSQMTGVPAELLESGVCARLRRARELLRERVCGQRTLIEALLSRLLTNPLRQNADTRPLSSALLLGPSGVGKTLIAELLAEALFGSAEAFLCVHCGAFGEGGIAKLVGTPYAGRDTPTEGALLPEFVREHPFGILLFDELEKAYETLWDLLLSLLDKGEFQGADGQTYSVRHCIVLCTSNAVTARDLTGPGIGFGRRPATVTDRQALAAKLPMFRRELLSRFDDLLVAEALSPSDRLALLRRHIARACEKARLAGTSIPGDDELGALLREYASAIDAEGGRAIERLAADTVIRSLATPREETF